VSGTGGCKRRPISIKRNLKIEANVVVSECTPCYRVVAYYILRDYFLHFISWDCFNSQNSLLVTPWLHQLSQ